MDTILLTDSDRFPFRFDELQKLTALGLRPIEIQAQSESDIIAHGQDARALLVFGAHISGHVIKEMPKLEVIARCGVGIDNIAVDVAHQRDVVVTHVPDFCSVDVAEHVVMLMLALSRKLVLLDRRVRAGFWDSYADYRPMSRIVGKTLGVVGFGHIGQAVAVLATALGVNVLAYDTNMSGIPDSSARHVDLVPMQRLLSESDFVSLHVPLTKETEHWFGNEQFTAMKPGTFFINTSRGPVVDEQALAHALQTGRLAGAGLDVLAHEPPEHANPLLQYDNVVLTPHSAANTDEALQYVKRQAIEDVSSVLEGRAPKFPL